MSLRELKNLGVPQLFEREKQLRREIMDMRFEHAIGKLLNTAAPAKARKELARVLTLLTSKQNRIGSAKS